MRLAVLVAAGALAVGPVAIASAQAEQETEPGSQSGLAGAQPASAESESRKWRFGLDGVLFSTFSRQGGLRGDTEVRSQNWLMVMGHRPVGRGTLTFTGMATAEPLTVGAAGYSEIFQEGEAFHGLQVTDRQHPHDLLMQASAAWRVPLGAQSSFTLVGAPVGQAALGPVPFMHRASSAENPTAPLSHHIFDSTHLASGVVLAGMSLGTVSVEGSVFRGREPDEHRYDVEFGALDSWSVRLWWRPASAWTLQASHGFLHEPEQLEPGNQRRTNGSASWFRQNASNYTAITVALGRTTRQFSTVNALLVEGTHWFGRTSIYGRAESLGVETEILLFPEQVHRPHAGELVDTVQAFTAGIVRDVARIRGLSLGIGGDVTLYGVPPLLQVTHGRNPQSFHVFLRLALATPAGRMWNATMGDPEEIPHGDAHDTAGHHHP